MYGIPSISPTVPPSWGEKSNRISLKFGNAYYCGKLKAKFVQCTFEVMDHYTDRLQYCERPKVKVLNKMTGIKNYYSNTVKLCTTATLGSEESGCCREVAILKRFKQESMYKLPAKKACRSCNSSREVVVSRRSTLAILIKIDYFKII